MQKEQALDHKYIDLEKSISELDGGMLKKLPSFIVNIIKRIIYQDQANKIFNKISHLQGVEYLDNMILELDIEVDIAGLENLPQNNKCLFVANHPLGFADALVLTNIIANKYGSAKVIANEIFMFIPQLHQYIAAVNVFDGATKDSLRALDLIYSQEIAIAHFPAGIVSRKVKGKIEDFKYSPLIGQVLAISK